MHVQKCRAGREQAERDVLFPPWRPCDSDQSAPVEVNSFTPAKKKNLFTLRKMN